MYIISLFDLFRFFGVQIMHGKRLGHYYCADRDVILLTEITKLTLLDYNK